MDRPRTPAPGDMKDSGPRLVRDSDSARGESRSLPPVEYAPGQMIGQKYRLVRRLGEGGMASVWVALNEALELHVAIKFIRGDLTNVALTDRLLTEARAVARLGHPAIVRVLDYGKTRPGDPYIVMELLNGEDLSTALERRGRLASVKAVRTLLPIAHALATAHDKGIVHRDLKPENVFLAQTDDRSMQPKLVDFGVVKLDRPEFKRLTDIGTAVGSPGYMSPEQARGLDVDHRTDIWSFCVMLYEVVTGRLPFDGKSYNALLRSIIEDQPAPITNYAAGDPELWAIIDKGLRKTQEQRWSSMRELGVALAHWLIERGVTEDLAGASLHAAWIQFDLEDSDSMPRAEPVPGREVSTPPSAIRARSPAGSVPTFTPDGIPSRSSTPTATPPAPASAPAPATGRRGLLFFGLALVLAVVVAVGILFARRTGKELLPVGLDVGAQKSGATAATTTEPARTAPPAPSDTLGSPSATPQGSVTPDEPSPSESTAKPAAKAPRPRAARPPKPKSTGQDLDIKTTF
jgi:eukaryotic-like serine/threonine-protein kinase